MLIIFRSSIRFLCRLNSSVPKASSAVQNDKNSFTLYKILGIKNTATGKEIKAAYYELARRYHPDANLKNAENYKRFAEISEAYDVLSDDLKRAEYDAYGTVSGAGLKSVVLSNVMRRSNYVLKNLFKPHIKKITETKIETQLSRSLTEEVLLPISFEESVLGGRHELFVPVEVKCETCKERGLSQVDSYSVCKMCQGTGVQTIQTEASRIQVQCKLCSGLKVQSLHTACPECNGEGRTIQNRKIVFQIPKLVQDGDCIEIKHPTKRKPIKVRFKINSDNYFERSGLDIVTTVQLPLSKAILGGKMRIRGIHGFLEIDVLPGTQCDSTVRLIGKGVQTDSPQKTGDQIIKFKIKIPPVLSEKMRKIVKELEEVENALQTRSNDWNA